MIHVNVQPNQLPFAPVQTNPKRSIVMLGTVHLQPVVSLVAGILILLVPRLLNYIVAIYLIVVGLLGLLHEIKL